MVKKRNISIQFPLAGLNKRASYKQSPPYATQDCLNVRPIGTINGRERGGSRPGLTQTHFPTLSYPIRLLASMTLSLGDGFTCYSDTFSGSVMAFNWTAATWTAVPTLPSILPNALAAVSTDTQEAEAVLDLIDIDTSQAYSVEAFFAPWKSSFHGKYRIYLRLDDTTPDIETDGVVVELTATGTTGSYTCSLHSYLGGVETYTFSDVTSTTTDLCVPAWLTVTVSSDTVTVYWNGVKLFDGETVDTHTGKRVGFGMECTEDDGLCLCNVFRIQYYGDTSPFRSLLIASANSNLYYESTYGWLTAVSTNLTLRDDVLLSSCQSGQKLYIADYGDSPAEGTDGTVAGTTFDDVAGKNWSTLGVDAHDMVVVISDVTGTAVAGTYKIQTVSTTTLTLTSAAGTGNCTYKIQRAPKIYDPAANTLTIMTATTGQVPTGCPLICHYVDRIVMAGEEDNSHVWYMSRVANELDWDYSQTDSQRAVAGTASTAGTPGTTITALVPFSDDYLLIACRDSLWRLRGDPAFEGSLDSLSRTVGIIGAKSWCWGPTGELVFLSLDGLYILPPGGDSYPVSLSRETLPQEFLNINPDTTIALLEYDNQSRGVHIYLSGTESNTRYHWWLDWNRKTFWTVSIDEAYDPTCTCVIQSTAIEDSCVLLGCRDGSLRRFSNLASTDCGTVYESYVLIGPLPLASDGMVGVLASMDTTIAEESGSITWTLHPDLTYESCVSASSTDTGTWTEGLNITDRPIGRGQAFCLKLIGVSGYRWELENINATIKECGKRRM